jgi:lactate permease
LFICGIAPVIWLFAALCILRLPGQLACPAALLISLAGGVDRIKALLTGASTDRRVLVLILAWGLGGFLEGAAGFGTPVIIPGGILIALGFNPIFAAAACLIANSAPTAFATVGIPVLALADVRHCRPPSALSGHTSAQ